MVDDTAAMTSQRLATWLCFAVLSLIGLSLQQQADLRLEVEPRFIQVAPGTPVTVTCTLSDGTGGRVPLAGCGFRENDTMTAWDIETGSATISNTIDGDETSAIITSNPGNSAGVCSLEISGLTKFGSPYILGCRVRPVSGAWKYAAMMVRVNSFQPLQYRVQPPGELVFLPGSDVSITCQAEHQLDWCGFYWPPNNTEVVLSSDHPSKNTPECRGWLQGRECGVTLLNVLPSNSGFVWSKVWSHFPAKPSATFVELLVATPPVSPPLLSVNTTAAPVQAGDMLHATCVVGESRPVSNITWLLGDEVIRKDNLNEAPVESAWRWNHQPQTITQRLSRRLTQQDDGKVLKCRAEHLALTSGPLDSNTHIIRVGVLSTDPCSPNPCGPNTVCRATGKIALCPCLPRHTGTDPNCQPECVVNDDCPEGKACTKGVCEDVCPGDCGLNALCKAFIYMPTCECPEGYIGDAYKGCEEEPCGQSNLVSTKITGGSDAVNGNFPWQAAIFEVRPDGSHKALCSGTLIKSNIVVTAAHCVVLEGRTTLRKSTSVKVVLGKLQREWQDDLDDLDVQRFDVNTMHVMDDYVGLHHDYLYDIALIKLSTNASLVGGVKVACVDWANTFGRVQLQTGSYGTVAGWGLTADTVASTLQWIDLPWVDTRTCRNHTQRDKRRLLTRDKFCAGFVNRSRSVCKGDSGGGLLFLNATNNRYYLRGVVSVNLVFSSSNKKECQAEHYTAFTSVGDYIDWIKRTIE